MPEATTNSLGMRLVRMPAGTFHMGSDRGEWDERPVHEVTIRRPFYVSATEVTNAQYERFDPEHKAYRGRRGVSKADDEAVVYVSWGEAAAFCQWLSEKEGKPYRLPTEAEWEYACRAGTDTPYWTGAELPKAHHRNQWTETASRRVNVKDRALRAKKAKVEVSLRVGAMPPNPWGLHAMHGNVEEWVGDWYGPYPRADETDPVGPADGLFKVVRGGSHNTALKYLRAGNRSATLPEDKHWLIGFRVVQAPLPEREPRPAVPPSMNDPSVDPDPAAWNEPAERPVFQKPIPFVRPDKDHPLLSQLPHHHCPTITWCENGDLLAAWFNTISEIGREMVIVSSRLRYHEGAWAKAWDTERLFFAPADRNTTGSCLLHDGRGRLYYFNAIADSGHHRDQCMAMSISEDSGRTWSRPRIISDLSRRHKYTPMDSAFVEDGGRTVVLSMDYAPLGFKANEAGSGVFISPDRGETWSDRITGKSAPRVAAGHTDTLAAGFHINTVRLTDGRLLAMTRTQGGWAINGHMTMSTSSDDGRTWTYRESPFPGIGGGQRLVLMRLNEGPLLLVSFERRGIFACLSSDEGESWSARKRVDRRRRGYMAATQTPDNLIHLITSKHYYRFNLSWLKTGDAASTER
jgi:formylglycine-generating enzyme required for sulfatase activity